jgi:hypothetical protein
MLYFHAGCHKTASTTFQILCRKNQDLLRGHGVFYPRHETHETQHSYLLHEYQKHGIEPIATFLKDCLDQAETTSCHSVLLSGENFENCLVDLHLAEEIEVAASAAGFSGIVWIFVERDLASYADSLYAELSKQGVVVSYRTIARSAIEKGTFYLSTERCDHIFVLDTARFMGRFAKYSERDILRIGFRDFITGTIGASIFKRILGDDGFGALEPRLVQNRKWENMRQSELQVEFNFLHSFVGGAKILRNDSAKWVFQTALIGLPLLRRHRRRQWRELLFRN